MGAVSEGIAGGPMIVIWQPHHKGLSASHWHPGTSVADDAWRLDGAILASDSRGVISARARPQQKTLAGR